MGDYVQTHRRVRNVRGGARGTVTSLDGDWLTVELPEGGRLQTHTNNVARLVRATDIKREEQLV